MRADIEFSVAVLPGREERYHHPMPKHMDWLCDQLAKQMPPSGLATILIGHSMGAMVAYLVAKQLMGNQSPPLLLGVAAAAPPDRLGVERSLNQLDDLGLMNELEKHGGGIPQAIRENPDALKVFLPLIRADLRLMDSFHCDRWEPLPIPIVAFVGSDDQMTGAALMRHWKEFTTTTFRQRTYPGDHFFPVRSAPEIVDAAVRMASPTQP
jgi:surfactin synthase thioesterase subunit